MSESPLFFSPITNIFFLWSYQFVANKFTTLRTLHSLRYIRDTHYRLYSLTTLKLLFLLCLRVSTFHDSAR